MKKLILSLALAAASVTAFAQVCPHPGNPIATVPPVAVQLPSGIYTPGQLPTVFPPTAVQLPVNTQPGVPVQLPINIFYPSQLPGQPPVYIGQLPINIFYPSQLPSGPSLPVDAQVVTVQPGKVVVVRGTTSK